MTVFLVEVKYEGDFYGLWEYDSIFSTKEKAEAYIEKYRVKNGAQIAYKVNEVKVDKEEE